MNGPVGERPAGNRDVGLEEVCGGLREAEGDDLGGSLKVLGDDDLKELFQKA